MMLYCINMRILFHFFGLYPEMELLDHNSMFSIFLRIAVPFSIVPVPVFYVPQQCKKESNFSISLPTLNIFLSSFFLIDLGSYAELGDRERGERERALNCLHVIVAH